MEPKGLQNQRKHRGKKFHLVQRQSQAFINSSAYVNGDSEGDCSCGQLKCRINVVCWWYRAGLASWRLWVMLIVKWSTQSVSFLGEKKSSQQCVDFWQDFQGKGSGRSGLGLFHSRFLLCHNESGYYRDRCSYGCDPWISWVTLVKESCSCQQQAAAKPGRSCSPMSCPIKYHPILASLGKSFIVKAAEAHDFSLPK